MSKTKKHGSFEYYEEDCQCEYCQFYQGKKKSRGRGCGRAKCFYDGLRADAAASGRHKRERGWDK